MEEVKEQESGGEAQLSWFSHQAAVYMYDTQAMLHKDP